VEAIRYPIVRAVVEHDDRRELHSLIHCIRVNLNGFAVQGRSRLRAAVEA
jgi:hypothetical protein